MIAWKSVPKAALVDVLRNWSLGPSNLSRQDKRELVSIAEEYLRANPYHEERFRADLDREIQFQASKKAEAVTTPLSSALTFLMSDEMPVLGQRPAPAEARSADALEYDLETVLGLIGEFRQMHAFGVLLAALENASESGVALTPKHHTLIHAVAQKCRDFWPSSLTEHGKFPEMLNKGGRKIVDDAEASVKE